MVPAFLLSLREGLEAALLVGIVLGVLGRIGERRFAPMVWLGACAAAVLSAGVAIQLHLLGAELEGQAEQVFEGSVTLLAAGLLTWVFLWISQQSRQMREDLERDVRRSAAAGRRWGIFLVAFFAVLREGVELALFFTAAALSSSGLTALLGAAAGLLAASLVALGLFRAMLRLDLRRFFLVMGLLLVLFAAGLLAHAVREFNEAGWVASVIPHVWDISVFLPEDSALGTVLKILFGYNANPSLTEVTAYAAYLLVVGVALRIQAHGQWPAQRKRGTPAEA
jgi:high-affinity iron transporter